MDVGHEFQIPPYLGSVEFYHIRQDPLLPIPFTRYIYILFSAFSKRGSKADVQKSARDSKSNWRRIV